jgi:hypothetical protein
MRYHSSSRSLFWRLPWSAPLRAALFWQADPDQFPTAEPIPVVPGWLRPLVVQRLVGQAVAARAAWQETHLCLEPYRFGNESEPDWHETNLLRYGRCLGRLSEELQRWILGMEVERILRLVQLPPSELGQGAWVAAVLAACEHVAQVYQVWRRYRAARAREMLREELQRFLDWRSPAEPVALE